ncbi:hypothetical protein B0H63DRAFT_539234 [Podospora didyma]|uniref:Transmembrane protein n=1 Tax=Podospora didyma TaxID=330526 RepID=A0AAE0U531_9PEZI|nr:hypothetical protein B0H63DRAFT_539234 [Podospora didyma]
MADRPTLITAALPPPPPPGFAVPSPVYSQTSTPRLGPRRQSRFTEESMQEATPTSSMMSDRWRQSTWSVDDAVAAGIHPNPVRNSTTTTAATVTPGNSANDFRANTLMRIVNAGLHGAVLIVVMAIMVMFLSSMRDNWLQDKSPSSQAVALLVLLGLDICLDIFSLLRQPLHAPWPCWALLLRLIYGIGYLTLFMVYIGIGRVFPAGYTYWSIRPDWAGPAVYFLLWVLGVWNLGHVALHRHHLGKGVQSYLSSLIFLSKLRGEVVSSRRRISGQSAAGGGTAGWSSWRRSRGSGVSGGETIARLNDDDLEANNLQRTIRRDGASSGTTIALQDQELPDHKPESGLTTAASSLRPSHIGGRDTPC